MSTVCATFYFIVLFQSIVLALRRGVGGYKLPFLRYVLIEWSLIFGYFIPLYLIIALLDMDNSVRIF